MKTGLKIGLFVFFALGWNFSYAQTEGSKLLSISHNLLLNPSFAGINKDTRIWTGLGLYSFSKKEVDHLYSLTYDSYSEKLKGGIACYFFQGLTGKTNTNNTGVGFTYSKPLTLGNTGRIVPSLNINYLVSTKQWFVYTIDGFLNKQTEPPSSPGKKYLRYHTFVPHSGILWDYGNFQTGLSASLHLHSNLFEQQEYIEQLTPQLIFYFTKKIEGIKKGLISQPVKINPELVILYSKELFLTRTGIRMESTDHLYGLFAQNDYIGHIHGITGIIGCNIKNLQICISTGCSYSIHSQKISFSGEAMISMIIPYVHYEEENPWKPFKKLF